MLPTQDDAEAWIFSLFRSAALCTKHPGFSEEQEWRIVHCPHIDKGGKIATRVETVRGVPQLVCKLSLESRPKDNVLGMNPDELVERVIIGPTPNGFAVADAFAHVMAGAGVKEPRKRIVVSDIPLRG